MKGFVWFVVLLILWVALLCGMPKNKNAFIRYRIIDGALRNKHKRYPTKQELIEACSGLGSVSARTIDGDIYDMKFDEELGYAAPIEYDRKLRGYYYADPNYSISNLPLKQEDLYALEFACSLLKQFDGIGPIQQFMQSVEKIEEYVNLRNVYGNDDFLQIIETEKGLSQKGNEYLHPLLLSIKEQQAVMMHYKGFGHADVKSYELHPYVLKEYRNRWYVTGKLAEKDRIQTFALERIKELIPTKRQFKRDASFKPADYFKHSFGISVHDYEPQLVTLSFSPSEAPYIKSQPLHQTQQILVDNEDVFKITLDVIPSYELKAQILSYGDKVKIIAPEDLKQEHVATLKNAITKYATE
jgi:predicted DNA-binding transcriptional regulator YafY